MENTLAAQYLRVSTERQEYSLDCQRAGIEAYARQHNLDVCRTYVDEAKSGLDIRNRQGLSQLLQDVLGGNCLYTSILVYDVSRWGRFQDPDEAAHYEFVCKAAGVRVHYCAEHFGNDTYLPNVILKALKRVMAGEYSRELSAKVFAGLTRLARDGYRTGGCAGYGLRRMLFSADKTPKGQIPPGEQKRLVNERVKLIPGPATEVHWVREIYRMYIDEHMLLQHISNRLNQLGIAGINGRNWTRNAVKGILTNPKYAGTVRYNATTERLRSAQKKNPEKEWIVVPEAFEAVVDPATFERAQEEYRNRPYNQSNDQLLEVLRSILKAKGKLTMTLIHSRPNTLDRDSYKRHFGSLMRAYELAGYQSPDESSLIHKKQIRKVRKDLMESLVKLFPGEVSIQMRGHFRRNCLRLRDGTRVTVRTCRRVNRMYKGPSWILPPSRDSLLITLLVCVNAENTASEFMYVLPRIANRRQVTLSADHSWFKSGIRIGNLSSFCKAVQEISRHGKQVLGSGRKPANWMSEDARAGIVTGLRGRWAAKKRPIE